MVLRYDLKAFVKDVERRCMDSRGVPVYVNLIKSGDTARHHIDSCVYSQVQLAIEQRRPIFDADG